MALEFDGADQYVDVGKPMSFYNTDFSICMLFQYVTAVATGGVVSQWGADDNREFIIDTAGDPLRLRLTVYDGAYKDVYVDDGMAAATRYHLVAMKDSGTIKLFLDSILQADTEDAGNSQDAANNVRIGMEERGSSYFKGLASVRIYNRALSLAEIKTIYYAQGNDNIVNGLVGRWLMNEKPDGTAAADASTVIDISGNGNHGTPVNGPVYRSAPVRLINPCYDLFDIPRSLSVNVHDCGETAEVIGG